MEFAKTRSFIRSYSSELTKNMRNINVIKVANVISVFVVMALILLPLFGHAQFKIPDPGSGTDPLSGQDTATNIILRVIQILLAVAGLVAVIFLIVGGFRYITAGGNEETAETAKKTIVNAIIGVVVVILAFVIVRVIANALISQKT